MATKPTDSEEDDAFPYDMRTFRSWVNGIRQQIQQMNDAISNATDLAQAAGMHAADCWEKISKLEQEHEKAPTVPVLPDSNGFWRDTYDGIWVYNSDSNNLPMRICVCDNQHGKVYDTGRPQPINWGGLRYYAPFTKIDNPFTTGKDHAD